MRSPIPDALFPGVRGRVLAALFLDPGRSWYLSDLARQLGVPASSLQRDLARLSSAGILRRRQDGGRVYYQPDPDCPFLSELGALLSKTTGLVPRLKAALRPLAGELVAAFVYGSAARGDDAATSDVDLMVVGSAGLRRLAPVLRRLHAELGREIHPVSYTPVEFAAKRRERDSFLASVLAGAKVFVLGSEGDLGAALGGEARRARAPAKGRARRASRRRGTGAP
jgi:predicted nucleotidyltransferase